MITETSKWLILNLLNLQILVLNLALVLLHTGTAVSIYHLSPEVLSTWYAAIILDSKLEQYLHVDSRTHVIFGKSDSCRCVPKLRNLSNSIWI